MAGRKTAIGSPCDFDRTRSSASDFENVYVLGQSPRSLE